MTTTLDPLALSSGIGQVFHIPNGAAPDDLVDFLYAEFCEELERGDTYPQEMPFDLDGFRAYYLPADLFVAVEGLMEGVPGVDEARGGREWGECVLGFYYIKPNAPGRSSHICNAGFVVTHRSRGKRIGHQLGESYLHFAPKLGYKASQFNLVYASNAASLAIWDRLGFTRVGVVPRAGRLKQKDGSEKYVDANIIWKSF